MIYVIAIKPHKCLSTARQPLFLERNVANGMASVMKVACLRFANKAAKSDHQAFGHGSPRLGIVAARFLHTANANHLHPVLDDERQ